MGKSDKTRLWYQIVALVHSMYEKEFTTKSICDVLGCSETLVGGIFRLAEKRGEMVRNKPYKVTFWRQNYPNHLSYKTAQEYAGLRNFRFLILTNEVVIPPKSPNEKPKKHRRADLFMETCKCPDHMGERKLPVGMFYMVASGFSEYCKDCINKQQTKNMKFGIEQKKYRVVGGI